MKCPDKMVLALVSVALWFITPAHAERAQIPLTLDAPALESLLRQRAFTGTDGRLRMNDDGTGCQYLELRDPEVGIDDGRIRVQADAKARAGRRMGGRCLLALNWRGKVELYQQPELDASAEDLVLRTTSWNVLREDGSVDTVSTTVGRWLEQFLPADIKSVRIGFREPMAQLREAVIPMVPAGPGGEQALQLDSLSVDDVFVEGSGVTVTLGVDVLPTPETARPAEAALTDAELEALQRRLDLVDAFFTNTIRSIGGGEGENVSAELLVVLVELRRDLVAILGEPIHSDGDSARQLFITAWQGLVPVLRQLAGGTADYDQAMRLLTFIGAGDALRALDELGPAVGIEISDDGLRRLARLLIPEGQGDPLQRTDAVDAELRRALGFGEPLPPPMLYRDSTWIDELLEIVIPTASAAEGLDPAMVKRLNNWVPKTQDMEEYLPMVRQVLRHVVEAQLADSELEGQYRELFRRLVMAAAWQESCWRQFMAKDQMRVPLQSGSGDLGIMQINPTVWRGLYDLHGLRWDIVYNARAGADILEHYLVDYALRHGEHRTTGSVDNLARSTYAAYNGGPRQYARYRRAAIPADELFYEKYEQIQEKELAVLACYGG